MRKLAFFGGRSDPFKKRILPPRSLLPFFLSVDDNLLEHVSPLGWEHINLTGDYVWRQNRRVESGKFRPLRPIPVS